jgi:hypothetical protein
MSLLVAIKWLKEMEFKQVDRVLFRIEGNSWYFQFTKAGTNKLNTILYNCRIILSFYYNSSYNEVFRKDINMVAHSLAETRIYNTNSFTMSIPLIVKLTEDLIWYNFHKVMVVLAISNNSGTNLVDACKFKVKVAFSLVKYVFHPY